ncbi:integrase catalytic domain-containing protein [Trichonephila clavipes]|nr:integrase catalytic domain-containing protein [Trichonephila clavipes]
MGGLWEAGIKSGKYHLKRALGRSRLTYEEFETVIIQVERILNSRPLTPISNDFDNFEIKPLAENNKGNAGSLEKMEYQLSEYSPTERKVDDQDNVMCGTMVIVKEDCTPVCNWLLGRVVEVYHGSDGKGITYFVDGLKYGEIQKAVRMADVQGLKSALLYALQLEAATQASRRLLFHSKS